MALAQGVHTSTQSSAATSITTGAISTTTGSGVVVLVGWNVNSGQTFTSITDSVGNAAPTQIGTELSNSNLSSRLYYFPNITGNASHTFTFTVSASATLSMWVVEVTASALAGITLDQSNSGTDTVSSYDSPSITTTTANEFLFGGSVELSTTFTNTIVHTVGNSFTLADEITDAGNYWTGYSSSRVVNATGTYNTSWTNSGTATVSVSENWIASFTENAGSGPTTAQIIPGITSFSASAMIGRRYV